MREKSGNLLVWYRLISTDFGIFCYGAQWKTSQFEFYCTLQRCFMMNFHFFRILIGTTVVRFNMEITFQSFVVIEWRRFTLLSYTNHTDSSRCRYLTNHMSDASSIHPFMTSNNEKKTDIKRAKSGHSLHLANGIRCDFRWYRISRLRRVKIRWLCYGDEMSP